MVSDVFRLESGVQAFCPRCNHLLLAADKDPIQGPISYALANLLALLASLVCAFMSFSVQGISQEITLYQSVQMLSQFNNLSLGVVLFASVIFLPAIYLVCILYLYICLARPKQRFSHHLIQKRILRMLSTIKPWLMVDVFLIGVLVSLVKIASLAEVSVGISFWAFVGFTFLVVKTMSIADLHWVWETLFPMSLVDQKISGSTFQDKTPLTCHVCGLVHPYSANKSHCKRCQSHLHQFNPDKNLQVVWVLLLTAIVFYIPANLYPMMYTSAFGHSEGSTIIEGVILLWSMGSYPIAMIIFLPVLSSQWQRCLLWHTCIGVPSVYKMLPRKYQSII